jgi:hypothetical protein
VFKLITALESWVNSAYEIEFPTLKAPDEKVESIQNFIFRQKEGKKLLFLPENFVSVYKSPLVTAISKFLGSDEKYQIVWTKKKVEEGKEYRHGLPPLFT